MSTETGTEAQAAGKATNLTEWLERRKQQAAAGEVTTTAPAATPTAEATAASPTTGTPKPNGVGGLRRPRASASTNPAAPTAFFAKTADIERDWDLGIFLVRVVEAEDYLSTAGKTSFKVRLLGLTGSMKGSAVDDYWPKEDKGLRKTYIACRACSLLDENGDIAIPGGAPQLVGKEFWVQTEQVTEGYRDKDGSQKNRKRIKIGFTSYYPKSKWTVEEVEAAMAAMTAEASTDPNRVADEEVLGPARTGEVVGVEATA